MITKGPDAKALLELITDVHRDFARQVPPSELYGKLLERILSLTASRCGFLSEVRCPEGHAPDMTILAAQGWTWPEDGMGRAAPVKEATPWGWVLGHGEALIINNSRHDARCAGLPAWHPPMTACVILPLHVGDEMVGILGMANREQGYSLELAASLEPLLHTTTTLISAYKGGLFRQTEQSLRDAQRMLTVILDTIPVRVFWKDRAGRFLGCNRLFARDAGLDSPELLIGKTDYDFPWAPQADLYRYDDLQVMETRQAKLHYEEPQTTPDGQTLWLETSKIPLVSADGDLIGILGAYTDITERKLREQALATLEQVGNACLQASRIDPLLEGVLDILLEAFRCDRAWLLSPCDPASEYWRVHMERHRPQWPGALALGSGDIPMTPDAAAVYAEALSNDGALVFDFRSGRELPPSVEPFTVRSQMCMAIYPRIGKPWLLGIHHCSESHIYSPHEQWLFEEIGRRIAESLGTLLVLNELKRFRTALDNAVDHIFLIDPANMRLVDVNLAAAQAMGYTREELLQKGLQDIVIGKSQFELADLCGSVIASARAVTTVSMHRCKDGRQFPVEVHISALHDEEGGPLVIAAARDITERIKAETALRTSNERYVRLFNALNDSVFICDLKGTIIQVNKKAVFHFGYKETEFEGMSIKHLHPDYAAGVCSRALANVVDGGAANFEIDFRKRNGAIFPAVVSARVLELNGETVIQGIVHDVSELKKAEDELHKYKLYLEQLVEQRTFDLAKIDKELESFGYTMSHDLRSPLREINGYIQSLLKDLENVLSDSGKDCLDKIQRAARRMGYLVDGLISLGQLRRSDLKRQELDLSDHAKAVIEQLISEEPTRRVKVDIMPQIRAYGDKGLLWTAIDNLLANAWKYTSKKLWGHIEFGAQQQDGEWVYYVKDNGIGFSMAQVNRLFGAFQRAPEAEGFEGVGIGLATVQRIIHLHGGRIWAKGEPNGGATFYFVLPEH